jgi:MtN3 and saliva related transmembrane protein
MNISAVGILASCCTSFGMIPQIIKGLKEKHLDDVSLIMLVVFVFGGPLWIYYGFARHDRIIIGANIISVTSVLILIFLKCYYEFVRAKC